MNELSGMKLDLFEIAGQNAKRIENHYKEIERQNRTEDGTSLFDEFVDFVKNKWALSINVRQWDINSFLISGEYKNMYQAIKDDLKELNIERNLDISIEEAAKKRMGIHFEKRKIFENQFEDSERFKYAAFNIGGLGLKKYGSFSLIIAQKEVEKLSSCAFLEKESIRYVDDNHLNIKKLKKDATDRKTVHLLAAVKNEKELQGSAKEKWPEMVCNEKNYIEAVTKDEISVNYIDTVRVSKDSHDMYFNYLYKAYSSQLDESEKRQLGAYKDMLKLLEKNRINKEIVDERGT